MANTKISQLPSATTPLAGTELVPIVQGGVTKNVAAQNVVTPGGLTTQIQYNNAGAFAGSANLTYNGTNVQIGATGALQFADTDSSNYVAFKAPAIIGSNVTWTLPNTDGAPNETLITNGSGVLSWATPTLTPTAPTNNTLPLVTGTPTVGQTLNSTTGTWSGYPAPAYSYQWIRGVATNVGTNSSSYTLVDADYNNTIKCTVTATNGAGSASATSAATAAVAGTVPGAPTIGTATPGNAQVSVAFTAPAVTGGPAITSYTATSNNGITGTGSSSPIIVSGLTNGTPYTFTVTATNSIGTGPASAASSPAVTPTATVQDASFAYVPLLLETTSTNGQNNQGTTITNGFLDSSSNTFTITRGGSPTQGSVTPYWPPGQWSNYFSSSYLSVADSASLRFGAANFTIEAWVFRTASGTTHTIAAKGAATPTGWVLQVSSANKLVFIDTSTSITGATSLAANTWYYVAVVRAGTGSNQTTLYVNGVSDGTGTSATTFSQTDAMRIGTDRSAANGFAGYISNLRLSNTNLTISSTPTTPLTALGSTIFLSCGYNRFVDGSSLNSAIIFGSGTPTVQAFQPFSPAAAYTPAAYGGSGLFNGSTDYVSAAYNSAFNFDSSTPFTIEFWFNTTGFGAVQTFISNYNGATTGWTVQYRTDAGNVFRSSIGNTIILDSSAQTINANTWYHFAIVRNASNSISMYLNGESIATPVTNSNAFAATTQGPWVGGLPGVGQYYPGYISNCRIVNGAAVYTGAFKPPTLAPLTTAGSTSAASYTDTTNVNTSFASSATSLLLNFANAGIYDAAAQNVITTVADAQVSNTITPKWGTTSMKFDGVTDALSIPSSTSFGLGTGDWTIEFWVNLNALTTQSLVTMLSSLASVAPHIYYSVGSGIRYYTNGADRIIGGPLTIGVWNYIAVTKSSGVTRMYINGTQTPSSGGDYIDANNYGTSNPLFVGDYGVPLTGLATLNGYVQDVRITKGVARTVTTIPTAPFPVQ
jgi:hypothetical protein